MGRGPVGLIVMSVAAVAVFALILFGPRLLDRLAPQGALALVESVGGVFSPTFLGGAEEPVSEAAHDPAAHLRDSPEGWRPTRRIAATAGNGAVFIDEVLAGRGTHEGAAPVRVSALLPVAGCTFTAPGPDSAFGHVSAGAPVDTRVDLATYGDADLAQAVGDFAAAYRDTGLQRVEGLRALQFDAFDVVVTETARPVYLVLQADSGRRLWVLHLAPGARLERVVLLGGAQAGIANLPDGVPVEAMRQTEAEACGLPRPSYPLNPGHRFFQALQAGHLSAEEGQEKLAQMQARAAEYEAWFRSAFGVSAAATMAGDWIDGDIAAIGPVPATSEGRAVWAGVDGAAVAVTQDAYLETAAEREAGQGFRDRVIAVATAFAWGDLKTLDAGVKF